MDLVIDSCWVKLSLFQTAVELEVPIAWKQSAAQKHYRIFSVFLPSPTPPLWTALILPA